MNEQDRQLYNRITDSLKLANRAELTQVDPKLVDALDKCYVDPMGERTILDQVLNPIPCFLVARKGTGKSTIFQKAQVEVERLDNELSVYLDVKNIYENVNQSLGIRDDFYEKELGQEAVNSLERYFLLKKFIEKIYDEILDSIEKKNERLKSFLSLNLLSERKKKKLESLSCELQSLKVELAEDQYCDLDLLKDFSTDRETESTKRNAIAAAIEGGISETGASVKSGTNISDESGAKVNSKEKQNTVLKRYLSIQDRIDALKQKCLNQGINKVHFFIDDYSELDQDAQDVVRQAILEPLYFKGDQFININLAAYPGRLNYGKIDTSKVETVYLDFQPLYSAYHKDVNRREKIADEKITELLNKRTAFFSRGKFETFSHFVKESFEDFVSRLFEITVGNPRYIGWLLDYAGRHSIQAGRQLTVQDLEKGSQQYYETKIEIRLSQFAQAQIPFDESSEFFAHVELFKKLIDKARASRKDVSAYKKYESVTNPPVNHFYIEQQLSTLLDFLELNFFISKFREAKTKSGQDVQIYLLNDGMCRKNKINTGRLKGTDFRDYAIEKVFERTELVSTHFRMIRSITCSGCETSFAYDDLQKLEFFNFDCPKCKRGEGIVTVSYESPLAKVLKTYFPDELKTDLYGLELLYAIRAAAGQSSASQLAGELDKHHVSIGHKARQLRSKEYIERETKQTPEGSRTFYPLLKKGEEIFFSKILNLEEMMKLIDGSKITESDE